MNLQQETFALYIQASQFKHEKNKKRSELGCCKAIQTNSHSSLPYIECGNLLINQGKFPEAEEKFHKAAFIHPSE